MSDCIKGLWPRGLSAWLTLLLGALSVLALIQYGFDYGFGPTFWQGAQEFGLHLLMVWSALLLARTVGLSSPGFAALAFLVIVIALDRVARSFEANTRVGLYEGTLFDAMQHDGVGTVWLGMLRIFFWVGLYRRTP